MEIEKLIRIVQMNTLLLLFHYVAAQQAITIDPDFVCRNFQSKEKSSSQFGWKVVGSHLGAGKDFFHETSAKEYIFWLLYIFIIAFTFQKNCM